MKSLDGDGARPTAEGGLRPHCDSEDRAPSPLGLIMTTPRIDPERLIDFGAAVYKSVGMPEADARLVADTLVQADLWGHQSHGVLRLGLVSRPRAQRRDEARDAAGVRRGRRQHRGDRRPRRRRPRAHDARDAGSGEARQGARPRRRGRAHVQSLRHVHVLHADRRARRLRHAAHEQRRSGHGAVGRPQENHRHQSVVGRGACRRARALRRGHGEHRRCARQDLSRAAKAPADTAGLGDQRRRARRPPIRRKRSTASSCRWPSTRATPSRAWSTCSRAC